MSDPVGKNLKTRREFLRDSSLALALAASGGGAMALFPIVARAADDEIAFLSLCRLRELLRRRELTAEKLTSIYLGRIARLNPSLNAFILVNSDEALTRARALDKRAAAGKPLAALHGIPVALKDDLWVGGQVTTVGSRALQNWIPPGNATAVQRLLDAGAIILGKTNLDEFTISMSSRNSLFGATHNPFNLALVPGGSSGGSAAAVSAGLCAAAFGSDASGSLRVPAAVCGVTGMKPSLGRVSRYGLTPINPTKDVLGPIARNAEDCAVLVEALSAKDPLDPLTAAAPPWKRAKPLEKAPRFGFIHEYSDGAEPGIRQVISSAISSLTRAGAMIEPVDSVRQAELAQASRALNGAEFLAWVNILLQRAPARLTLEKSAADLDPLTLKMVEIFRKTTAEEFCLALNHTRFELADFYDALLVKHGLFILPTTSIPPYPIEAPNEYNEGNFAGHLRKYVGFRRPCELAGLVGLPAITVPAGFDQRGLPVGIQIVGKKFADAEVLAAASWVEKTLHAYRRPPTG